MKVTGLNTVVNNKNKKQAPFKGNPAASFSGTNVYDKFVSKHNSFASAFSTEDSKKKKHDKKPKEDPLLDSPLRALAYTNEVGVALAPAVGKTISLAFWAPALMYFGADIWDKYKRGQDNSYHNNDKKTAFRQAVFHAAASVVGPTAAILGAEKGFMKVYGNDKVDELVNKIKEGKSNLPSKVEKAVPLLGKKLGQCLNAPIRAKKLISNTFKTGAGFVTLALVAIPLDILTEKLLIKRVVNPALGLKNHDKNPYKE